MPPTLGSFEISVYGSPYDVKAGLVLVPTGDSQRKLYKQLASKNERYEYVYEDPIAMQKRIEENIVDLQAERVRNRLHADLILACVLTCCIASQAKVRAASEAESLARSQRLAPSASPASQRPARSFGEAGKPSPESAAAMMPPPPPKRPSSLSARAAQAQARLQPSDIGKRQQAATGAAPPRPPVPREPPPPRSCPPSRGDKLQAVAAAASQVASAPESVLRAMGAAMSREMSRDASPVRPFPDLMGDAAMADAALNEYKSPRTEPRLPSAEPAARRSSETLKGTTMTELAQRLEASVPMTRGRERISKAEQRAWAAEQKKESRARLKHQEESCTEVMVDIARYDLPLVQLLMAEFALQPCNEGSAGQMRWHFLEQYGRTCHTLWADVPSKVLSLPEMARVLRTYKPARVLLLLRLHAIKQTVAQLFSGAHRLGKVEVDHGKTLMQMRIDIFADQRRSGRTADDLESMHPDTPQLIQTMENGRYSLDFRHAVHVHRHFSCNGSVLSYANTTQSAISGALLFIKNLTKDALPPVMSRQAMTRHDQHFDWAQRLLGCRELREANSVLTISYDDASQRGVK